MENLINENLRGFEIKLMTKPGVFFLKGVDSGSRLLIDNLEVKDGTMICDLGTGAGIIGVVCAKLNPAGHVHMLGDHLSSSELAKKNIELNNLKNAEVYLSDLFSAVEERTYHLIVSNPPQHLGNDFLDETTKECFKHLKFEGEVY
ncbi:MAG: methyltransferase [Candidatus Daviesbacteria bacterium]|nr:methyltransferase [Candidatus Daviesbacteria bacterium]